MLRPYAVAFMAAPFAAALAASLAAGAGEPAVPLHRPLLSRGRWLAGSITGAQKRSYRLVLRRDQYVRGDVRQRGVDVVERVYRPGGRLLDEFDSPTGATGTDTFAFIAEEPGGYRIEIAALEPANAGGRYDVALVESRSATRAERQRMALERDVKALDRQWHQATMASDTTRLGRLYAAEFTALTVPRPASVTREAMLEAARQSRAWAKAHPSETWRHDAESTFARIYGNTAIVWTLQAIRQTRGGKEGSRTYAQMTDVWHRRNGRWEIVASQFGPAPDRTPRKGVTLAADVLAAYAGSYGTSADDAIKLAVEGDYLAMGAGPGKVVYVPESETDFFVQGQPGNRIIFVRGPSGQVSEAVQIWENGFTSVRRRLP